MSTTLNVVARLATIAKKATGAFFNVEPNDTLTDVGGKVGDAAAKLSLYTITDYWLMITSGVYIVTMDQKFGYGPIGLFFLMWAFDIIVACVFIVIWQRTGEDITVGVKIRRALDSVYSESRIAGHITLLGVSIKSAAWDGPERFVFIFHKEVNTELKILAVILTLTAIQSAIWTPIFVLGFESVYELFSYLFFD